MVDQLPCPVCQQEGFSTRMEELDIPYFGEVLELVYLCDACGFRRVDLHVVNESDPVRYELTVEAEEDLSIRVVRSSSGHFEIPELGVRAEPAEATDAFVSNVEGVLERCEAAIITARNGADTPQTLEKADALLEKVDRLRNNEEPWTLIIEDALGNSAILSDRATRIELTEEEAEELGHPFLIIDLEDLRESGPSGIEP